MYDIFLSYSTEDRERLRPLVKALDDLGWSVFWDHRSVPVGKVWHDVIGEAVNQSRCVVVAWSEPSIRSEWVKEEAMEGKERGVLFPILLDNVALPFGFKRIQAADFRHWNGKLDYPPFMALQRQLQQHLGVPVTAKPPSTIAPSVVSEAQSPELPIITTQSFEPVMLPIKGGTFMMGCVEGRDDVNGSCWGNEKPAHQVTLDDFYIGKYAVTFDEWDACEKAGVCPHAKDQGWGRGQRPVINVSWNDVQTYIAWLNQQTGKHYRLPTEAEWEYAARGGKESAYPWGNSISRKQANYGSWFKGFKTHRTQVVGSYQANGYGLYDTFGNVWEWVADWYGEYSSEAAVNPQGAESGGGRVLRGGSWRYDASDLRSANRSGDSPTNRDDRYGFRLALGQ